MIYRGMIGCANPQCFAKMPFAVQVDYEDERYSDECLSDAVAPLGWIFDLARGETAEETIMGYFCPRCSYALDQAS